MVTSGFFRGKPFDPKTDIPDLSGQVYIVTGGTKGIGFGIVSNLLQHNVAKIIILSSQEQAGKKVIDDLKQYGDSSRVTWRKCNLSNLKETDQVAKRLRDEEPRIDALVLNAGIGVAPFSLSDDGIDQHSQINWLSQLHMGLLLLPNLKQTYATTGVPSRFIMMSSEMHRFTPRSTEFASLEELNTNVGATRLYARSKLAQILLVRELVRRAGEGQLGFGNLSKDKPEVLINATHPGGVKTPQQYQLKAAYGWFLYMIIHFFIRPLLTDPMTIGCRSGLFASTTNPALLIQGFHGKYIVPDQKTMSPSKKGQDDAMAKRLWDLSMNLLRDRLGPLEYEKN